MDARQGRRERRYAGISARLRTPHRAAQRAPAAQSLIAFEALRLVEVGLDQNVLANRSGRHVGERERRVEPVGEALSSLLFSLGGSIVLLILYRKLVQKRTITGPS